MRQIPVEKNKGKAGGGKDQSAKDGKDNKSSSGKSGGRKKKKKEDGPSKIERALLRPLMMVRKVGFNYVETFGTIVPGFTPKSKYLGMADQFGAPGWDFVAGLQPDITDNDHSNDWLTRAANKGWITDNVFQNRMVEQNYIQDIGATLTLEPFQDFKISIDAKRSFTENTSMYFKDTTYNDGISNIVHASSRDIGSFNMTYFAMNTLFNDDIIGLFQEFEQNREVISARLGNEINVNDPHLEDLGYRNGLGRTQQDVLIPAFLAAYTGKDPNTVDVSEDYAKNVLFKSIPKLNWQLTYSGLSKIPAFKELFSSVNITHGYRSTLTVNSFQTNQEFRGDQQFTRRNDQGNFYSRFEIPALSISEQFAPLIGVNMRFKNDMNVTFDYARSRNLAMSFNIDYQLAESKSTQFVIGFGHTIKNVIIPFLVLNKAKTTRKKKRRRGKKSKKKKDQQPLRDKNGKEIKGNNLNFKFDFSFRDDITINHRLDQGVAEPTSGSKTIAISPSVDYDISKQLNVRAFFDYRRVVPATSATFPSTNYQGGLTIRFTLN